MNKKETKKTIRTFALASFLNDMGSDMIYPIWPLFVTTILHANMAVLGFLDGLGEALVSISQALSGYLSDRLRKRKIFIWTGYLFGSISRIGYALSTVWQHLIPFRILDRAGKIRSAPRDAIVADVSTREDRGRNFGLLRTMDNLGAVFGIIVCILFFGLLGYKKLFLLAAIPSLVAVLLVLTIIKEGEVVRTKIHKVSSLKRLNKNFKFFLFTSSLFALGSFSYSFLLIFAKEFGFKVSFVPVLYLIFTATASLMSLPFGRLADKLSRKFVLILSYVLWALVSLTFIFVNSFLGVISAFIFYGLHLAAREPVQRAFVSELSPLEFRATSLGAFQMVIGLCALPASLIAGFLWNYLGRLAPFYLSLVLTTLSIIMLMFVKEKR